MPRAADRHAHCSASGTLEAICAFCAGSELRLSEPSKPDSCVFARNVLLLLTVKSPVCGTRVTAAYGFPFGTKSSKKPTTHRRHSTFQLLLLQVQVYRPTRSVRRHSGPRALGGRQQKTFTTRSLRILSTHSCAPQPFAFKLYVLSRTHP